MTGGTLLAIVSLAVLIAAIWWPIRQERKRDLIGKEARTGAPGDFARLSQGVTYYRWFGPTRGPVIVAIHGLTTPSAIFEDVAEGLGGLGYRVLVYDLYGRGLSDAAAGAQDRDFFVRQLTDLLGELELDEELTLLGYSMGGSIATAFAQTNPHMISRLMLVAPAGIILNEDSFDRFCRQTPILGDWVFGALAPFVYRRRILADPDLENSPDLKRIMLSQFERRGYLPAVLASRRGVLAEVQKTAHQDLDREGVPVLALWGERDTVIPISALGRFTQWNRSAQQDMIPDAGHGVLISHGKEVIASLTALLTKTP